VSQLPGIEPWDNAVLHWQLFLLVNHLVLSPETMLCSTGNCFYESITWYWALRQCCAPLAVVSMSQSPGIEPWDNAVLHWQLFLWVNYLVLSPETMLCSTGNCFYESITWYWGLRQCCAPLAAESQNVVLSLVVSVHWPRCEAQQRGTALSSPSDRSAQTASSGTRSCCLPPPSGRNPYYNICFPPRSRWTKCVLNRSYLSQLREQSPNF